PELLLEAMSCPLIKWQRPHRPAQPYSNRRGAQRAVDVPAALGRDRRRGRLTGCDNSRGQPRQQFQLHTRLFLLKFQAFDDRPAASLIEKAINRGRKWAAVSIEGDRAYHPYAPCISP